MGKYTYDKDYFKTIDSPTKAYWLGFLYADGCITRFYRGEKLKSMSLELTLNSGDIEHIKRFRDSLNSNVPLQDKVIKNKYYAGRMVVNCTSMCRDLISLGCTPQKSLTVEFPSPERLDEKYVCAFIKGYFDGNGCFFFKTYPRQTCIRCYISCGSKLFLQQLSEYLLFLGIQTHKIVQRSSNGYALSFSGTKNIQTFIEKIYSVPTPELERKKKTSIEIMNFISKKSA